MYVDYFFSVLGLGFLLVAFLYFFQLLWMLFSKFFKKYNLFRCYSLKKKLLKVTVYSGEDDGLYRASMELDGQYLGTFSFVRLFKREAMPGDVCYVFENQDFHSLIFDADLVALDISSMPYILNYGD